MRTLEWCLLAVPLLIAPAAVAADASIADSNGPAALAFARYVAGLDRMRPWSLENIEIDGALPKVQRAARLRAIRRLLAVGKPQYQVLETEGDETVRRQVIVRYLSAEAQAARIPDSAVAITPAHYKFRYKGAMRSGDGLSYIFQITPRKKREGLIKGEMWVDGETGIAVRQSGRLVKTPSIFLKRVEVTREIVFQNGIARARVTHLTVATRLVGVAELTIVESPIEAPDDSVALTSY